MIPRAFKIDDDGDITYVDPAALNSTVVHLIVIAKDNGVPPRQVFERSHIFVENSI